MKVVAGLSGAIISGGLCFIVFVLVSKYQIAQVGYTPSQSDRLIDIFIVSAPIVMVIGAFLGLWGRKRYLAKRTLGR